MFAFFLTFGILTVNTIAKDIINTQKNSVVSRLIAMYSDCVRFFFPNILHVLTVNMSAESMINAQKASVVSKSMAMYVHCCPVFSFTRLVR